LYCFVSFKAVKTIFYDYLHTTYEEETMTILEHIEAQVQQLSPSDFAKFREWFQEYAWQQWDRQIEQDSKSGKLQALAEKALADHAAGRTKPL
jgi:hypothetical protein